VSEKITFEIISPDRTILKIEDDSNIYEHDSYTVFKNGRKEKNEKSVHYLIQKEKLDLNNNLG
jgi:hypothetical protein